MFSFDNVIGNRENILNMEMSLKNKKVFHSYIVTGEEGIGKLFITNCFIKKLQCETNDACDNCYSCRSFELGNNPDVIYVKQTKTNNLSVDDIREQVKLNSSIKPYACRYKIFVLENADKMTVAAQNALLKILEEPPNFLMFFLLGENIKNFLPTIISRCAIINMKPVPIPEVKKFLTQNEISEDLAQICSVYSQGNIGRALKLAGDEKFITMREKIIEIINSLANCNVASALLFVNEFENFKDDLKTVFDIIYFWYADLIFFKSTNNASFICNTDKLELIAKNNDKKLYSKIDAIEKAKKYLSRNTNFKLTFSSLLLVLSEV